MYEHATSISGGGNRSFLVVGTQLPWIEALALELNASHITTLDYTRKTYGPTQPELRWHHVNDYLDSMLSGNLVTELFDNAASYSSIEHSGLGRYGDALAPDGDIDALKQIHCLLKPNGLLFLGLPTSVDDSSYVDFNFHRVYGSKRLARLIGNGGWHLLSREREAHNFHTVFVLRKVERQCEV